MKKKSLLHSFSNGRKCKKIQLIMRLSLILMLAAVFNVTASVYSQSVRVDLKLKDATLEEVFQAIQDQSEFDFFYKNEILSSQKTINKTFKGKATLVVTSIPYNSCQNYGKGPEADCLTYKKYLNFLKNNIRESAKLLRTGGRLIINVDSIFISETTF